MPEKPETNETAAPRHFIQEIINEHNRSGRFDGRVHTRFPPEPNGYMHIGHAKAFYLNWSIAQANGGLFNLRFDDTNPLKEDAEYVESIQEDIAWMGCGWEDRLYFASDYFEQLYKYAEQLIEQGDAFVDSDSDEEIRKRRGTVKKAGENSPHRDRAVEENLDLFRRMRAGEFPDGAHVLRAKIDMASPNMLMRDPLIYRIRHASHHRRGNDWCIYPLYDWAHGLEDSIEGITHSLCSLEFDTHRPVYDWFLDKLDVFRPQQIEFARLNISYTVLSKRHLGRLVEEGQVSGWDDPRLLTISGLRRRGYTPSSIREFLDRVGVARADSVADPALLDFCIREELNRKAERRMTVLRPLKLVITNYPENSEELLDCDNNPEDESAGKRQVPFCGELWVERDDFREEAPKKWFRLAPGKEVRLKHAYFVTCDEVIKDESGEVVELRCSYDPESRGGASPDGRKVRGTLHWVSARHGVNAEVRLYDHLFSAETPGVDHDGDFTKDINPDSLEILAEAMVEPSLGEAAAGARYQFLRHGYFFADPIDSKPGKPVFNRTVGLRDSWAKLEKKLKQG